MKKTDILDVYNLYLGVLDKKDGRTIMNYVKVTIAFIPTLECSLFCKSLFENDIQSVIIECKFLPEKKKWVPLQIVDKKVSLKSEFVDYLSY